MAYKYKDTQEFIEHAEAELERIDRQFAELKKELEAQQSPVPLTEEMKRKAEDMMAEILREEKEGRKERLKKIRSELFGEENRESAAPADTAAPLRSIRRRGIQV